MTDGDFNSLYQDFVSLRDKFTGDKLSIKLNGSSVPATQLEYCFWTPIESSTGTSPPTVKLEGLRKELWETVFPAHLEGTDDVRHLTPSLMGKIDPDLAQKNLPYIRRFFDERFGIKLATDGLRDPVEVNETFKNLRRFAGQQNEVGRRERLKFLRRYPDLILSKLKSSTGGVGSSGIDDIAQFIDDHGLDGIYDLGLELYSQGHLDVDDFLHRFNAVASDSHLMRLMGLIYDFEITIPVLPEPTKDVSFTLAFEFDSYKEILVNASRIKGICRYNKYAYLVEKTSDLFIDSVLDGSKANPISYDPIAVENNLITISSDPNKKTNGSNREDSECLTRGFIYTHPNFPEIIAPLETVKIGDEYTADYVSHGHRVGVEINSENLQGVFSLTAKSFDFADKDKNALISQGYTEGCVHFDSPLTYLKDGAVQGVTDNTLFEYSGELLSLGSAFSRSRRIKRSEYQAMLADNQHDGGMSKAEYWFRTKLRFLKFPFNENIGIQSKYQAKYGIPDRFLGSSGPKLRYGWRYRFVVYQEYLNGWGLPLTRDLTTSEFQLTIQDLGEGADNYFSPWRTFLPLENSKPPLLFHTRKEAVAPPPEKDRDKWFIEREDLESLVVRSISGSDQPGKDRSRHVLPERVPMEQAFFYDLFSGLGTSDSFDIKKRHNCPFSTLSAFKTFQIKESKCFECKEKSYCGGTQMEPYYEDDIISPKYIADPTVHGFTVELFWDKECTTNNGLAALSTVSFQGKPGLGPKSRRLILKGANSDVIGPKNERPEITLKKGMKAYARLANEIPKSKQNYFYDFWWKQLLSRSQVLELYKNKEEELKHALEAKTKPKILCLVHAVKEPLFTPTILTFFSSDLAISEQNLKQWLQFKFSNKKARLTYEIGRNIVAHTPELPIEDVIKIVLAGRSLSEVVSESTKSKSSLKAFFERLDAIGIKTNNEVSTLPDEVPSGALELFMRKEEFVDDFSQHAFDPETSQTTVNHVPTEPIVPFTDFKKNKFSVDHKLEYSPELMSQLKDPRRLEVAKAGKDPFRSLNTSLDLEIDLKSKKFEEREYYLRNTSKFKGFFTDDTGPEETEDYLLPKTKQLTKNDSKFRFKLMVLGSKSPRKPELAFAVTTIRETRIKKKKVVTSTQRGNILTIYLHRGRNTSGKNERVGIIVKAAHGIYNDLYLAKNLFSRVGRDVVSDTNAPRSQFIRFDINDRANSDVLIPNDNLYDACFDPELGIISYLPQYDFEKQLWKFEVEFNIKTGQGSKMADLHNPFINLTLVHHQPFSLNYNELPRNALHKFDNLSPEEKETFKKQNPELFKLFTTAAVRNALASYHLMENDCRISETTNAIWGYLNATRTVSALIKEPGLGNGWGSAQLQLFFDSESLNRIGSNSGEIRSNFLLTVEGSRDKEIWYPVLSCIDDNDSRDICELRWELIHPLLDPKTISGEKNLNPTGPNNLVFGNSFASKRVRFKKNLDPCDKDSVDFGHFRLRLVEVEWFDAIPSTFWEDPSFLKSDILENEKMRTRYIEIID